MDDARILRLDASNVMVRFEVGWIGKAKVRGRFGDLRGTLRLDEQGMENAAITMDVAAKSIATGITLRDLHLRGPDFLDAAHWPFISFRSDLVTAMHRAVVVDGVLSLRGIERRISVRCPLSPADGRDSRPTISLGVEFVVHRREHRVGVGRGLGILNPLFIIIGNDVHVRVELVIPATYWTPVHHPALGR
jgi:polyisoprenoid-binding protein YceI